MSASRPRLVIGGAALVIGMLAFHPGATLVWVAGILAGVAMIIAAEG